jgi:hypothetical protein
VVTSRRKDFVAKLMHLRLGFLNANNIRILLLHPCKEALAGCGANSIRVQTDNSEQAVSP